MVFKYFKTLLHKEQIQIENLEISLKCSNKDISYILEERMSNVLKELNKLPGENTGFFQHWRF